MSTRTISKTIRKPGVYIEFNTTLALNGLPANAQRVCFIVPITVGEEHAAPALEVTRILDATTAREKFGQVASGMVEHALRTFRGINLHLIGIRAEEGKNPDLYPALDALMAVDMELIVSAWMDESSLTTMRTHIIAATNPINQKSRIGVAASTSTLSSAMAIATKINHGAITLALLPGAENDPVNVAAAYAAVLAAEEDPARPMNTVELPSLSAPSMRSRLMRSEQEIALTNGLTPLEVGPGEAVQIVRAVSTYTKAATGDADVSLLDITTMRTLYYVREACRSRIRLRFPRAKLGAAGPTKIRSELLDVLKKCADERVEILKNVDEHADALVVERTNDGTGRLQARIPADVVEGLHVIDATIDLYL